MKKNIRIFSTVGFLLLLASGWVGMILGPDTALITNLEHHEAAGFPNIEKGLTRQVRDELDTWFSQRICGRSFWLKNYIKLNAALGASAFPNRVLVGRDGWLFVGNEFNQAVEKTMGIYPQTEAHVVFYLDRLKKLAAFCSQNNIPLVHVVAPNKEAVYPEFAPDWMKYAKVQNRPENRLAEKATTEKLPLVNLTPFLIAAKNTARPVLYRKQNSHWNRVGAWFGYRVMMSFLQNQAGDLHTLPDGWIDERMPLSTDDDLREMLLDVPPKAGNDNWLVRFGTDERHNLTYDMQIIPEPGKDALGERKTQLLDEDLVIPITPEIFIMTYEPALNNKRLLLISDSFSESMNPYFVSTFREIIRVHQSVYWRGEHVAWLIQKYKPDVIVLEQVARTL
jgi:hypothetical protein